MRHSLFTIVSPIKAGCLGTLTRVLAQVQADLAGNRILALSPEAFPEIHFASFVIFNGDTLVFENAIDGSIEKYLRRLAAAGAGIDQIYDNCQSYDAQNEADRLAYFRRCRRRPQLHHIGTPYRSAVRIKEDQRIREQIDARFEALTAAVPPVQIERPAAGVREYWNWEVLKPWVACIAGPLLAALEVWLLGKITWHLHPWWSLVIAFDAFVVGAGALSAFGLWRTTPPDLRRRVKPSIIMALPAVGAFFIPRSVWTSHPAWALALIAFLAAVGLYSAWTAVVKLRSARLAAIRFASAGASPIALWRALQATSGPYTRERPIFLLRLWNWKWWPVSYALILAPVYYFMPGHKYELAAVLVLLFFVKAIWLGVLVGWPSGGPWIGWSPRILGFVLLTTAIGSVLVGSMFWLHFPRPIIALLVLVALISLWAIQLPSPEAKPPVVNQADLQVLVDLEDHDAQNHMSAMVTLPGSRLRAVSLKLFLGILNHVFYRALLPDWWRGMLFGLPTVHFAQWVLLDSRRYLFLSNYDLSWTSYLDDFGMQLTAGIQKIWGQGVNNPGTADLGRFKDYVRTTMVPHLIWYRAYPGLTVRQIWNNENLRHALARETDEEAVFKALRRLGAAPKVVPDIVHGRAY